MKILRREHQKINSTSRMENYSDAFLAIIITLLVLEIELPVILDSSWNGVTQSIMHIGPHLLTFIFSFLTLSVFWVNHHHFFHELDHADWKLLWYNNMLLFWLALVPLTTRFLASAITVPAAVGIYSFVLFMAAGSFTLLSRHAIFVGDLLDRHITEAQKKKYYRRSCFGVVLYGIATLVSPILYPLSFFLILFIPVYFTAPRLMHDHSMHLGE